MTRTATDSFTLTHAKYLASKVTTDMLRCQQLYGYPSNAAINNYGTELALLLRDGYISIFEFGFQRNDHRLLSWRGAVRTSVTLMGQDIGNTVTVLVHVLILSSANLYRQQIGAQTYP